MSQIERGQGVGRMSMGLFERFNTKLLTPYLWKVVFIDFLLCFYVYFLLKVIDEVLSLYIVGYQPTESYLLAVVIFFFSALVFFYFSIRYRWTSLFPYFFMALSVFFPLVFLSALLHVWSDASSPAHMELMSEFCLIKEDVLCGKAFSYLVFSMTIRALPVVLTVPFIYWFSLKFLKVNNPQRHTYV